MNEDYIRKLAEEVLGRAYTDEEWTPILRSRWKQRLHMENYGVRFVNGEPVRIDRGD